MKKNILYAVTLVLFTGAIAALLFSHKSSATTSANAQPAPLVPRKGASATAPEWNMIKQQAVQLTAALQANPQDAATLTRLAALYIREARATGNHTYYDKAALECIERALQSDANNLEAMILKSLVYISQHHFAEGLELANAAKQSNPYNAFVYGVIVDGNVEMGYYDSAVVAADKMLSIRPDLRSYARASYLREIYGDYPGAIAAMKMAVEAGPPGDENTEWSRTQLGLLYEHSGDLSSAAAAYQESLDYRPGYAYALAGLARIAAAKGEFEQALDYYRQADAAVTDIAFKEGMAEVYAAMGNSMQSRQLQEEVIAALQSDAEQGNNDASIGHYADKELAYAYLNINDTKKALEHAQLEYNRRPDNIDVNECLAWVYYAKGDYSSAMKYISVATRTGCKHPALLSHAGLIYAKAGKPAEAKQLLDNVLQSKANISHDLKQQVTQALQQLSAKKPAVINY